MTTETLTLTAFILARIAEDEATAREAGSAPWEASVPRMVHVSAAARRDNKHAHSGQGYVAGVEHDETAAHIARHDPARVLAECEAKRRIVERCDYATTDEFGSDYDLAPRYDLGLEVLQALALPYADHPDCREEWKP